MSIIKYLKSIIQGDSANNAKSFSMVISVLVGLITGLCVCFVLIYDVVTNGYIKTNLIDLGMFSLCIGGYITGSSIAEIFGEKYKAKLEEKIKQKVESQKEEGKK